MESAWNGMRSGVGGLLGIRTPHSDPLSAQREPYLTRLAALIDHADRPRFLMAQIGWIRLLVFAVAGQAVCILFSA